MPSAKIVSIGTGLLVTAKSTAGVWRSVVEGGLVETGEEVRVRAASAQYARAAYKLQRKSAGVWTDALTMDLDLPSGHSHFRQDKLTITGDDSDSAVALALTTDKGHGYLRRTHDALEREEQKTGGWFTYKGANWFGAFSDLDFANTLDVGGFEDEASAMIVASREQFADAGVTPTVGQRLTWIGTDYKIVKVQTDEISFTLTLASVNR